MNSSIKPFRYQPLDYEKEKASNGYLMSLFGMIIGLPLPIANFLTTFFYYLANRKSTYFVRWHCTQALISQTIIFILNSFAVGWTIYLLIIKGKVDILFVSFIVLTLILNVLEFIGTVYAAIRTRKGEHVELYFLSEITNKFCTP